MKTIVFDFDGVIHKYSKGWQDGTIYDSPDIKVVKAINELLKKHVAVAIVSTRNPHQICTWCEENNLFPVKVLDDNEQFLNTCEYVGVTNRKIPAMLYVDDRSYRYNPESVAGITPRGLVDTLMMYLDS